MCRKDWESRLAEAERTDKDHIIADAISWVKEAIASGSDGNKFAAYHNLEETLAEYGHLGPVEARLLAGDILSNERKSQRTH